MKFNKFLTMALVLCLALCLVPFSASAGSCDACVDEDRNRICDICAECVGKCFDFSRDGNHACDACGKDNVTTCDETSMPEFTDHVCTDCGVIRPSCDVLTMDYCEGCGAFRLVESNFPDANFRNYLINDYFGSDAPVSALDLLSCTQFRYAYGKGISDLTGIELFPYLQALDCGENNLTSLDVSKNPFLERLDCWANNLTSLDLSQNTQLKYLRCEANNLTNLDLSKNTALETLYCGRNDISSLDLSKNTALTFLQFSELSITSLDLSKNTALEEVSVNGNSMTSLTLGELPALKVLYAYTNKLTKLDVSGCPALELLHCENNRLTELVLCEMPQLYSFSCGDNPLPTLDVTKFPALTHLSCGNTKLTSLDLSKNSVLEDLSCINNKLTGLDLSGNPMLKILDVTYNQIASIDLSSQSNLVKLYLDHNKLTSLDVSNNPKLEYLCCTYNKLTTLDLSNNPALFYAPVSFNQITSIKVNPEVKDYIVGSSMHTYYIDLDENNQFDLSTLPAGFDISKAGGWPEHCSVSGNILTVKNPKSQNGVRFAYDMGNGGFSYCTLQYGATTERIFGENRYETAFKVADKLRRDRGGNTFDAVVLANGYNFADALSGSYLAAVKEAPILLTWIGKDKYNYLNEQTVDYIKGNLIRGGTVYILGGESAVPKMVDDLLVDYNVVRLAGENRFETNLLILKEAGVKEGDEVLVCTASGFADSLSASAVGKPIMLVHKNLSDNQKAYLETLRNCSYTMIGGTSAVSDSVMQEFDAYGATTRLAGSNRFETSVKVAEKYFSNVDGVVLAYAKDFPDGLCGGPLAYAIGRPLILTMAKGEAKAAEYIRANDIREGLILGGEKLISSDSVKIIFN